MKISFLLLGIFLSLGCAAQQKYISEVEKFISEVVREYNIPGIQVIVIKGDDVAFQHAGGYASLEDSIPMSITTPFYIASNTKAFTGLAISRLISENKLDIDDPISAYIGEGIFSDEIPVEMITVGNLLGHTSGMSNDPLVVRTAYTGTAQGVTAKQLLQYTTPWDSIYDFSFHYSNTNYIVAGMIIEEVTGMSWKAYFSREFLPELGLKHISPYVSGEIDYAQPYNIQRAEKKLYLEKSDNTMHAAGGLMADLTDMGKWLMLYTTKNRLDFVELSTQILTDLEGRMGPYKRKGYAYGWIVTAYNGTDLYLHFGSYPGFESMMSFMPEEKLGVFVFVNEQSIGNRVAPLISNYIYDTWLEKENRNDMVSMVKGMIEQKLSASKSDLGNKAKNLDEYIGFYHNSQYGDLVITKSRDSFVVGMGELYSYAYVDTVHSHGVLVELRPGYPERLILEEITDRKTIRYEGMAVFTQED